MSESDGHARGTDVEIYDMQIFFSAWRIKTIPGLSAVDNGDGERALIARRGARESVHYYLWGPKNRGEGRRVRAHDGSGSSGGFTENNASRRTKPRALISTSFNASDVADDSHGHSSRMKGNEERERKREKRKIVRLFLSFEGHYR